MVLVSRDADFTPSEKEIGTQTNTKGNKEGSYTLEV